MLTSLFSPAEIRGQEKPKQLAIQLVKKVEGLVLWVLPHSDISANRPKDKHCFSSEGGVHTPKRVSLPAQHYGVFGYAIAVLDWDLGSYNTGRHLFLWIYIWLKVSFLHIKPLARVLQCALLQWSILPNLRRAASTKCTWRMLFHCIWWSTAQVDFEEKLCAGKALCNTKA